MGQKMLVPTKFRFAKFSAFRTHVWGFKVLRSMTASENLHTHRQAQTAVKARMPNVPLVS